MIGTIDPKIIKEVHRLVNKRRREIGLKPWVFHDVGRTKWNDIMYSLGHVYIGDERIITLPPSASCNQMRSMVNSHRMTYLFKWKIKDIGNGKARVRKVGEWLNG